MVETSVGEWGGEWRGSPTYWCKIEVNGGGGGVPLLSGVKIEVNRGGGGVPPLSGVEIEVNAGGGRIPPLVGAKLG